jgi:predicted RNase H-like HicB family nuclease
MEHNNSKNIFLAVIEQYENGYSISVPDLINKGGATWGETKEQAIERIKEVIEMIADEIREEGETFPSVYTLAISETTMKVKVRVPISV